MNTTPLLYQDLTVSRNYDVLKRFYELDEKRLSPRLCAFNERLIIYSYKREGVVQKVVDIVCCLFYQMANGLNIVTMDPVSVKRVKGLAAYYGKTMGREPLPNELDALEMIRLQNLSECQRLERQVFQLKKELGDLQKQKINSAQEITQLTKDLLLGKRLISEKAQTEESIAHLKKEIESSQALLSTFQKQFNNTKTLKLKHGQKEVIERIKQISEEIDQKETSLKDAEDNSQKISSDLERLHHVYVNYTIH